MSFENKFHHRSIHLKDYDYSSAGAYFVTICAHNRDCLFGEIINGEMMLNDAGKMVEEWWKTIPLRYSNTEIDVCVVMPNHFHGIIIITDSVGAESISAQNNEMVCTIKNHVGAESISVPDIEMKSFTQNTVGAESISAHCCKTNSISQNRVDIESTPTKSLNTKKSWKGLPEIIQTFKRHTTIEYIKMVKMNILPPFNKTVWQRNYYEHIIRDESDLRRIRDYIVNNPARWQDDEDNPRFC